MMRMWIGVLVAVVGIAAAVLFTAKREGGGIVDIAVAGEPRPNAVDLTSPSSAPVERTSASVGRPEPIAADSETPPAATQPEVKAKRAPRPKLSKTLPADDDPDSPGWDVTVVTHTETDNYALSWCEIVGIPDDKRLETAVIAIHAGAKWKDLCGTAGTPEAVTTPALEELRKWRRDELVKVLGDDLADAYIAGIQAKQGF